MLSRGTDYSNLEPAPTDDEGRLPDRSPEAELLVQHQKLKTSLTTLLKGASDKRNRI